MASGFSLQCIYKKGRVNIKESVWARLSCVWKDGNAGKVRFIFESVEGGGFEDRDGLERGSTCLLSTSL